MEQSLSGSLNVQDYKKWARNVAIFSSPAALAFLMALQTHSDIHLALGALYQAILASLIDLVRKFIAGE